MERGNHCSTDDASCLRLRSGLEARRQPADDALGEGGLAEKCARRISAPADGARSMDEPQWVVAVRHGRTSEGSTDRQGTGRSNPRAILHGISAFWRDEAF